MTQPFDPTLDGLAGLYEVQAPVPTAPMPEPGGLADYYALGPTGRGPIGTVPSGQVAVNHSSTKANNSRLYDGALADNSTLTSDAGPMASSAAGYGGAPFAPPSAMPQSASDATDAGTPPPAYGDAGTGHAPMLDGAPAPNFFAPPAPAPAAAATTAAPAPNGAAAPERATNVSPAAQPAQQKQGGGVDPRVAEYKGLKAEGERLQGERQDLYGGQAKVYGKADEALEAAALTARAQHAATLAEGTRYNSELAKVQTEGHEYALKEWAGIDADNKKVAAMKVDPSRMWKDRNVGQHVLAALGAALGGAGAALTGGPNQFMSVLNAAVDADIDAQKSEISNARDSLAARRSGLATKMAIYGDQEKAIAAQRDSYYQGVDRFLQGVEQNAQSAMARANVQKIRSDIELTRNEEQARFVNGKANAIVGQWASEQAARAAAQKRMIDEYHWEREQRRKEEETAGTVGKKTGALEVPYLQGSAKSEHAADKVNERLAATVPLVKNLRKLADLRESLGATGLAGDSATPGVSEKRRELMALAELTTTQLNVANGQGAISGGDYERTKKMLANVEDWTGSPHKVLREMANTTWSNSKDYAKGFGVTFDPARTVEDMDRSVNFTPSAAATAARNGGR